MKTAPPSTTPLERERAADVVICAYTEDRWDLLTQAVESVLGQDGLATVVVVIDHNDALLTRASARWPELIVVENHRKQGLSGARNTGVEATRASLVAFLDDDAVAADDDWLRRLVEPFADPHVGLTAGRIDAIWEIGRPAWFPAEFAWVVGCSYIGLPTSPGEVRNPIGASMAVRRAVFDIVGPFDENLGRVGDLPLGCEETEFAIRARAAGHLTWYQPDSVARHHVGPQRHRPRYFLHRCRIEGHAKAAVARLTGAGRALSAERRQLSCVLPRACGRELYRMIVGGAGRIDAARTLAMMFTGTAAAATGYVQATVQHRRTSFLEH